MHRLIFIIFICTLSQELVATTGQRGELIIYEGETLELLSLPLETYLGSHEERLEKYPTLKTLCSTDLWRSYQGLWKLEGNELFLVDLYLCDEGESLMAELFNTSSPVKADWYTGDLLIQHGKVIKYFHLGFNRYYEEETVVKINQGNLISQNHFVNGYLPDDSHGIPDEPDSVMVEFYKRINWDSLPERSKDYRAFISVIMGEPDSLAITRNTAPKPYLYEIERVIREFPSIRNFYSRGKPLTQSFSFQVIFSEEQRKRVYRLTGK